MPPANIVKPLKLYIMGLLLYILVLLTFGAETIASICGKKK